MAFLRDEFPEQPDTKTQPETDAQNVGALTPIHAITLKVKPPPKPELYRPANAGRLALRPDREIVRHLMLQCLSEGITMTRWFEREALSYLKKHATQKPNVGAQAPQIDRRLREESKLVSSIREIFEFWVTHFNRSRPGARGTETAKWTDRDTTTLELLGDVSPNIVEMSIIQCIDRYTEQSRTIGSFGFFRKEILAQTAELGSLDPANIAFRTENMRQKQARYFRLKPPKPHPYNAAAIKMLNGKLD